MAKPFYDRLIDLDLLPAGAYPWTATTADDANYAPANIGQLKNVFNIDVRALVATLDTDGDGLPDAWEIANGLNPNDPNDANADPDGDGLTNREEFEGGTDPNDTDSDNDGATDDNDLAPNNADPNDPDGDSLDDAAEIALGTDKYKGDTDDDGIIDPVDAVPTDEVIAFPKVAIPTYALLPVVLPDPNLVPKALDNQGRILAKSTSTLKLILGDTVTDIHVNGSAQSSNNPRLRGFSGNGAVLFNVPATADLEADFTGYWVFRPDAAQGYTLSQLMVPLPLLFERFSGEGSVHTDMEPSILAHVGMAFPYHPVVHFLGGDGSVRGHQFVYYNPPSDPPYSPPLPWVPIRRYDELHHEFTWAAASNLPQTALSSTQVQWPNGVWADATIAPVTQYYLGNDTATLAARIVQTHALEPVEVPGDEEYLEFEGTGIEVFLGDQLVSSGATSQFAAPVWINDMPDIHVLGVTMNGSVPEAEIWRKVDGAFALTRLRDGLVNGTELAFDEPPLGTGPLYLPEPDDDTSYNPVVQGESYLKLNDRGEVLLGKTSGLWRNGKRESLDELSALIGGNEIVSAPGTGSQPTVRKYQITEILDLNDSGVMLARYRIHPEDVDGGYAHLIPIELTLHRRGTINSPGIAIQRPGGSGATYEAISMENADWDEQENWNPNSMASAAETNRQDGATEAVNLDRDDDFVRIRIHCPAPRMAGSIELVMDRAGQGERMQQDHLRFYDVQGDRIQFSDLRIEDLQNPSGHLAPTLEENGLDLFVEIADLGQMTRDSREANRNMLQYADLILRINFGGSTTELKARIYRGGTSCNAQ